VALLSRDTSQTPWEVLHSQLSFISDWPLHGKKRHFPVHLCYTRDMYTWQRRSLFIRDKSILSSEKMLHEGYDRKGSAERLQRKPAPPLVERGPTS
jgi:hypothetical protein